jgi:hypothetical protein
MLIIEFTHKPKRLICGLKVIFNDIVKMYGLMLWFKVEMKG